MEHVDGYNDGKAKYDMVIIDCLGDCSSTGANLEMSI
jgi:hypothetical protein